MKICLIGNSHLGPVAAASSRRMVELPQLTFGHYIDRTYGKVPIQLIGPDAVETMPSFRLEEGQNIPTKVSIEDWDAFIVVGLGFSVIRLVEKWSIFQPDCLAPRIGKHLLVPELVDGYDDASMDSTKALALIGKLRALTDKPVGLVPGPLPAAWVPTRRGGRFDSFLPFADPDNRDFLLVQFEKQIDRLRRLDVDVIRPPVEAIVDDMWTRSELCLGQPSDGSPGSFYARGDFYHMNRRYGDMMSRSIVQSLIANTSTSLGEKE